MFANVIFIVFSVLLPQMVCATESGETDLLPMGLKVMGALVIVLGLVLLLYALLKKSGRWIPSAQNREIKLIEVRYLAPKKALYLVEVKGTTLLISATNDRMETLVQWPDSPSPTPSINPSLSTSLPLFEQVMQEQTLSDQDAQGDK